MTVSNISNKVTYTGDGATTALPVTFPFYDEGDLVVTARTIATGAEAVKVLNTDYTVSGGAGSTGTVTAATAPAATVQWVISRATPKTQEIDYVENDPFPAATHEEGLDRAAMRVIDMQEQIDRAPKFPLSDPSSAVGDLPSSVDRAGKFLYFNATTGKPEAAATTDTTVSAFMATVLDDTTADAALATLGFSAYMYGLKATASATALRTAIGLAIGTDVQAKVLTTRGDLVRGGVDGAEARLALGTSGQVLGSDGTDAVWLSAASQAEMETGTEAAIRSMSPLRVAQAIAALGSASWGFESAETTITANSLHTVAHGLGAKPKRWQAVLICKTTEYSFAVGDEIDITSMHGDGSNYNECYVNATNMYFAADAAISVNRPDAIGTGGPLTFGNWKLIFRASVN